MVKIIITDGYTLNPGDLDWTPFHALGEIVYYDRTPVHLVTERCKEATIIITNKTPVTAETIRQATNLQLVAVTATGHNVIDSIAAKEKGIPVCNVPIYGTDSVAQHTFALLLELTNQTGLHAQSVAGNEWSRSPDWSYVKRPLIELSGKTMGIVGFGRIGQQVATIAKVFGMRIIFYNKGKESPLGRAVSLTQLFDESDVVSLHCPLTKENDSFVGKELLGHMKPTAFLVNTSRGQLINEQDLATGLASGVLAGAALDVLRQEPPPLDHPLIGLPNCYITPHIAWKSFEARRRLLETTLTNVKSFLGGHPENVVNG